MAAKAMGLILLLLLLLLLLRLRRLLLLLLLIHLFFCRIMRISGVVRRRSRGSGGPTGGGHVCNVRR